MPLSLISFLSRRHHVTELAPYEWSRSIFLQKSGDYAPHSLSVVAADAVWCLTVGKPTQCPTGGETEKKGEMLCHVMRLWRTYWQRYCPKERPHWRCHCQMLSSERTWRLPWNCAPSVSVGLTSGTVGVKSTGSRADSSRKAWEKIRVTASLVSP